MRSLIVAKRIWTQIRNDKRTLALLLVAPLLILTLLNLVFGGAKESVYIGILNAPSSITEELIRHNGIPIVYQGERGALNRENADHYSREMIERENVTAVIFMKSGKLSIWLDGSDSVKAKNAMSAIEGAMDAVQSKTDKRSEVTYVYGTEDMEMFDSFASILMGFLVFFLVFLIAGVSFLKEKTTGTLEKLLSTPIKRWEIVVGYVLGYGGLNVVQSAVLSFYLVYVLGVVMVGSIWLVLLITLLTAITALTMGMLLSAAASSEFQMVQFIPVVIVPQVFFTGLFTLSSGWEAFGRIMPLYYTANALKAVMLKDAELWEIMPEILVLIGFSVIFMALNVRLLKRYRAK